MANLVHVYRLKQRIHILELSGAFSEVIAATKEEQTVLSPSQMVFNSILHCLLVSCDCDCRSFDRNATIYKINSNITSPHPDFLSSAGRAECSSIYTPSCSEIAIKGFKYELVGCIQEGYPVWGG